MRYDFHCPACDRVFEGDVPLRDYPRTLPCLTCGAVTERVLLAPTSRTLPDAVVVYRAPDGSFRFPGETGGASCAKYESMGYQRVEARGFAEVRRLEKSMNQSESSHMARMEERRLAAQEYGLSMRRSEIRRSLEQGFQIPETRLLPDGTVAHTGKTITVRMRQQGRDAMREMMARDDAKGPRRIGCSPGLFVDVYSNDRSNRDESRDPRGRRRRD